MNALILIIWLYMLHVNIFILNCRIFKTSIQFNKIIIIISIGNNDYLIFSVYMCRPQKMSRVRGYEVSWNER